ncbi:hypothetical protein B0H14DRAFT_3867012 [Mycena olivaceomarginata]|nr:hypothetical protein B0H14DRAFT_3867012 [Mycena olivaceomarginata]
MFFPACLALAALISPASAYFKATAPQLHDQWANGEARTVSWTKGAHDGVTSFDIEMSRLSTDGLTLIAKNVRFCNDSPLSRLVPKVNKYPACKTCPPGDDYFLLFLNSTHGVMYGTSPRFSILPAGGSTNGSTATNPKVATVTVSGAPNPTQAFATTFPVTSGGTPRLICRWAETVGH